MQSNGRWMVGHDVKIKYVSPILEAVSQPVSTFNDMIDHMGQIVSVAEENAALRQEKPSLQRGTSPLARRRATSARTNLSQGVDGLSTLDPRLSTLHGHTPLKTSTAGPVM